MFTGQISLKLQEPKRIIKSLMKESSPLGRFSYELQNVALYQRLYDLDDATQLRLEKQLATRPWICPHILNRALKIIIPQNTQVFIQENCFQNPVLPIEAILVMRELKVSQGTFETDFFEFCSFGLQDISITVNDFVFPGQKMRFLDNDDSSSFKYFDVYRDLIYDKDDIWSNTSSWLSYDRFANHKSFIIRIDMSNGNFRNSENALQAARLGQGRLKLSFDPAGTPTRPNLEVLLLTKEYATISFNALRQISRDYAL